MEPAAALVAAVMLTEGVDVPFATLMGATPLTDVTVPPPDGELLDARVMRPLASTVMDA